MNKFRNEICLSCDGDTLLNSDQTAKVGSGTPSQLEVIWNFKISMISKML
jgi:hypothetical protein